MSADRLPNVEDTGLAVPLGWVTGLIVRQPKAVLLFSALLALVALLYTAQFLSFRTSRLDLLNPADDFNRRWIAYLDEFGREDDAVVVVEAVEGSTQREVTAAIDDLAQAIAESPEYFHSLLYKRDLSKLRAKGLHYATTEQVQQAEALTAQLGPILDDGDWSRLTASGLISGAAFRILDPNQQKQRQAEEDFRRVLTSMSAALSSTDTPPSILPSDDSLAQLAQLESRHLLSKDGRLGFLLLRIKERENRFDRGSQAIGELRQLIAQTHSRHPGVTLGLTGMPVLENDEMRTSQDDMIRATLFSLACVALLFVAGFGGIRHPLMTVAALLLAMMWSFGYVTLVVGHLNILSVSFGVILIGLGIDFGIHYVARYLQIRKTVEDSGQALVQTASSVGPGIVTGGLTTALAFCTAAMTRFTGIAELGVIAGGGIVLCIIGALVVLPAMVQLSDARRTGASFPSPLPLDRVLQPLLHRPWRLLIAGTLVVAVVGAGAANLRYDHNLLNLQPKGIESVRVEEKLLKQSDRSVWFALSVADSPAQLRQRKAQFEKLPSVDRIEEIVSLVPEADAVKSAAIARIAERLALLPETVPQLEPFRPEAEIATFTQIEQTLFESKRATDADLQRLAEIRGRIQQLGDQEASRRITLWQQAAMAELWNRLDLLRSAADPAPPTFGDIPESLKTRFLGKNGRHLMKVFANGDVWDMDSLAAFVADVSRIDPNITGHPVQTYHASRQMQHSYIHAAIYSLLAVLIVLMVDFRSIRYSLLAILPMGFGLLLMFGLLGVFDIPLNPANMIVLPLILGIGIDDGVHVVHDFRRQNGAYRLSGSTATAVLITSATTIAGFGSMMIVAQHQGLRSLGQVLTIGVLCCLVTSLLILPALLALISQRRQAKLAKSTSTAETSSGEALHGSQHDPSLADEQPLADPEPVAETDAIPMTSLRRSDPTPSRDPADATNPSAAPAPQVPRRRAG
ncbi:MAG: MMPL family transporter [Pirellulaceae bacterium]